MAPRSGDYPGDGLRTAIAFSLDGGYLEPLKAMLFSMSLAGQVDNVPLLLLTDDLALASNEFCERIFDKIHVVEDTRKQHLETMSKRISKQNGRQEWNRGTLLKWEVFQDHGYDRVVFLDADMVCLGSLHDLLSASGADLIVGPQFQNEFKRDEDGVVSLSKYFRRLKSLLNGNYEGFRLSINSGVMVINRNLMDPSYREGLETFALTDKFPNEQKIISRFFDNSDRFSRKYIPSAWNFHDEFLWRLPPHLQVEILSSVKILHFAGRKKPWVVEPATGSAITSAIWTRYYRDQRRFLKQEGA